MSAAANNWLKDRPLVTVLLSFLGSLILAFTVRAADISKDEKKEINDKIDSKASIEYVDKSFINHEGKEQLIFNRIESLISLGNDKQDAVLQGIKDAFDITNKRLERIEDKIN